MVLQNTTDTVLMNPRRLQSEYINARKLRSLQPNTQKEPTRLRARGEVELKPR